jgi:hypothetical protein
MRINIESVQLEMALTLDVLALLIVRTSFDVWWQAKINEKG